MTSPRIRAGEDRQAIAKQCGTSVEMLERGYSFAIEDLEDEGPRPAAEERRRARELANGGRRASWPRATVLSELARKRSPAPNAREKHELRLRAAEADRDFAAPAHP
jgi:hypothetical protein